LLDESIHSPEELKKFFDMIKQSAQSLGEFTSELNDFIYKTKEKIGINENK